MIIERSLTCKNSSKNQFLEEFSIYLLSKDCENIEKNVSDEVIIQMVGKKDEKYWEYLPDDLEKIQVLTSISHGKYGSCHGKLWTNQKSYAFSIQYEFVSTSKKIIQEAMVFLIEELK